jgi:hypothetical protein
MAKLSQHYAIVTLPNGDQIRPIDVSVTADETWAPYIQASIVVPSNFITDDIDPRTGTRLKLRLQQDFGDLIYNYEITADFSGDVSAITAAYGGDISDITRAYTKPWNIFEPALPISTVTAAYGGDVSNLTAADLMEVWRMSDFLHAEGTFNPAPSTIFESDLGVRSIAYDYVSKEATIQLSSDEALTQDVHGYGDDIMVEYDNARSLINEVLNFIGAELEPGDANYIYEGKPYQLQKYEFNLPNVAWDFIETITQAAGLKLYCDELRRWYLVDPVAISGDLALKDDDNITAFTKEISREGLWYNQAVIQYQTISDGVIYDNYYEFGTGELKTLYIEKTNIEFPGMGAAQSIVQRSLTRGEIYSIEAIANFDARPRQTLTVDITGEPVKSGVIQSVTWSLPSARMSIDIRDLQEVI